MDHGDCPVMSSKPSDPQQQRPDSKTCFIKTAEVSTGRSQMLTTDDIGDWDAVVNKVPNHAVKAPQPK